jgi:hypothetical protein
MAKQIRAMKLAAPNHSFEADGFAAAQLKRYAL